MVERLLNSRQRPSLQLLNVWCRHAQPEHETCAQVLAPARPARRQSGCPAESGYPCATIGPAVDSRLQNSLFWVICIAALLGNAAIFRARASIYAERDDEVLAEAHRIVRILVLYVGGLLSLLAVGASLGLTGRFAAFDSRPLTTFDTAYLALYVVILSRATWWVFFQHGADLLAEHHRMFKYFPSTRAGVMLLWLVATCFLGWGIFNVARYHE
jgi:hypothetical protein